MGHLSYLAVLLFIIGGTVWLEYFLRTRVLRRPRRLFLSVAPVLGVFLVWDQYAIASGHWSFSEDLTTGLAVGDLPLEEVLFFIVVPIASILTLEAVRSARGWNAGDEVDTPQRPDVHRRSESS
jgi:lycopene cyclase domain-containing protein